MPKYIAVRTVGQLNDEEIQAAALRPLEAVDRMPGVRWIRFCYSAEEGKIYCEYEAPSAEMVFEHARRARIRSTWPKSYVSWNPRCSADRPRRLLPPTSSATSSPNPVEPPSISP